MEHMPKDNTYKRKGEQIALASALPSVSGGTLLGGEPRGWEVAGITAHSEDERKEG